MQKYHNTLQETNGDIITTATVTVYLANTGTLATLYQDDEIATYNNPFTVSDGNYDTNGAIFFKAENGDYDIKVVNGANTTWLYGVSLLDPDGLVDSYANITALRAITIIPSITLATIKGYYTDGDGGANPNGYYWDSTSTETDDGLSVFKATAITTGRWKAKFSGAINIEWGGAKGDGDGSGGGTNDALALQSVLDFILVNGGGLSFGKGLIYRCDSGLTLQRAASSDADNFVIYGNGATIDFNAISGSTIGFDIGATSQSFISEEGGITINDFALDGNENADFSLLANTTTDSCIGFNFKYALNVNLNNVKAYRFHTGFKTEFSFPMVTQQCYAIACVVGVEQHHASNAHQWNNAQITSCRFACVIRGDQGTGGEGIDQITYYSPRIESCYVAFVVDAGDGASANDQVKGFAVYNPFMNDITTHHFILNRIYDESDAVNTSSWANSAGEIYAFVLHGGRISASGGSVILADTSLGSIFGANIQSSIPKANITGIFPSGVIMCFPSANLGGDADHYFYDSAGVDYVNISDGSIRTNVTTGGSKMTLRDTIDGEVQSLIENKSTGTAASTKHQIANETSGALNLICYGASHATLADQVLIESLIGHLVFKRAGATKLRLTDNTGNTGGASSAGAGNQYVELEIAGSRYKLLHDGTL